MDFKCDICKQMKDVGDVIRTKPYAAERRVACYDCIEREDAERDSERKKNAEAKRCTAFHYLKNMLTYGRDKVGKYGKTPK